MDDIYFCFPYRGVGGVPILFIRIAEYLAEQKKISVNVIDYSDGFMATNIDQNLVNLVIYDEKNYLLIPDNAIVIFQSMTPWSIFQNLKYNENTRFLFWNCHPFNLIPTLPGLRDVMSSNLLLSRIILKTILRNYQKKMKNFIELISANNSLLFMDNTNLKTTEEYLNLKVKNINYLPIPGKNFGVDNILRSSLLKDNEINFTWIGRIVDFKYYILKHFLEELDKINNNFIFNITIVGEGDYLQSLKDLCSKLKNLNIQFINFIEPFKLEEYIKHNSDIILGMGTSALDGASIGVPVILLDISYKNVSNDYIFNWLFNTKNYNLGKLITYKKISSRNNSLIDMISDIITDYESLSQNTLDYYKENHSLPKIADMFLKYVDKSKMNWKILNNTNLTKRGTIYSMYYYLKGLKSKL